jgi:hypothetical protein
MWFFNWRTEQQREDLSHAYLEMDDYRFPAGRAERNGAADDGASFVIPSARTAGGAVF